MRNRHSPPVVSSLFSILLMAGSAFALAPPPTGGRLAPDLATPVRYPPPRPAMATTPPRGTWVVEGDVGAGQVWRKTTVAPDVAVGSPSDSVSDVDGETAYDMDVTTDFSVFLPSLHLGVTDRLHVGILSPGAAYRFGERGRSEWVPFFDLPFGLGYSSMEGFIVDLQPRLGLTARHWVRRTLALAWTLSAGSAFRHRTGRDCSDGADPDSCGARTEVFERGGFDLTVGLVIEIGDRITLAPTAGVGAGWDRVDKRIGPPWVRVLGAAPNGLWSTPLLRVHVNDNLAVGVNVGATLLTDLTAFGWDGGVNLIALW